ncbi:MAG: RDD family protein, partial [Phycisphaerales bacterium]|nr:RDD family protein [Phycisphaerales bacterium]
MTQASETSAPLRPHCPLCEESFGDLQFRFLYERPVCVPCVNAFARRRILAFIVDCLFLAGLALIGALIGQIVDHPTFWRLLGLGVIPLLALFLIRDGYDGQSPGKRLFDLQTIHAQTGAPVRFR